MNASVKMHFYWLKPCLKEVAVHEQLRTGFWKDWNCLQVFFFDITSGIFLWTSLLNRIMFSFGFMHLSEMSNKIYFWWLLFCHVSWKKSVKPFKLHALKQVELVCMGNQLGADKYSLQRGEQPVVPKEDRRSDPWVGGSSVTVSWELTLLRSTFKDSWTLRSADSEKTLPW